MSGRRSRPADAPLFEWGDALRAARNRRRNLRRWGAAFAVGAVVMGLSAAFPPAPRLVWNVSASVPLGLYSVAPGAEIAPGDMVVARLPEPYRMLAATRRYLPVHVPLVKHVAAAAGDEVCALRSNIFVNGIRVAMRRIVDAEGRAMPSWQGCVRLSGRQLFLLIADNPASFDGRYFGVTQGSDVIGKARLLWAR
ncbi:S26 family signal peptidase [Novosphingobium sp. G106]|uniref:S26 family signal peptidase n=1 Tax=Novosphingobium sp. G106 TaxID=2849500 RepID=UPI001C2DD6D1|nr:S26 family signal peptidase [Novosphingobium sp. G106]MBV1691408.1 S26 family signal peptidase [Novosphingobium sp. G106]